MLRRARSGPRRGDGLPRPRRLRGSGQLLYHVRKWARRVVQQKPLACSASHFSAFLDAAFVDLLHFPYRAAFLSNLTLPAIVHNERSRLGTQTYIPGDMGSGYTRDVIRISH